MEFLYTYTYIQYIYICIQYIMIIITRVIIILITIITILLYNMIIVNHGETPFIIHSPSLIYIYIHRVCIYIQHIKSKKSLHWSWNFYIYCIYIYIQYISIYLYIYIYLVGGLEHLALLSHSVGNVIIPTDGLHWGSTFQALGHRRILRIWPRLRRWKKQTGGLGWWRYGLIYRFQYKWWTITLSGDGNHFVSWDCQG